MNIVPILNDPKALYKLLQSSESRGYYLKLLSRQEPLYLLCLLVRGKREICDDLSRRNKSEISFAKSLSR